MKWFYDLMKKVPLLTGILGVSLGAFFIRNVGSGEAVGAEAMLIRIALCSSLL